jgi:hypothetical protein
MLAAYMKQYKGSCTKVPKRMLHVLHVGGKGDSMCEALAAPRDFILPYVPKDHQKGCYVFFILERKVVLCFEALADLQDPILLYAFVVVEVTEPS